MANPITDLRKNGHLDEAIALGKQVIAGGNASEWDYNALFWCHYDKAKTAIGKNDFAGAQARVSEMEALITHMPASNTLARDQLNRLRIALDPTYDELHKAEQMSKTPGQEAQAYQIIQPMLGHPNTATHEQLGWILYRHLKAALPSMDSVEVRRMLARYINLRNARPSLLHSMIMQLALSHARGHDDFKFARFFEMWGPTSFRDEDRKKQTNDGVEYNSLVHRVVCQLAIGQHAPTPEKIHAMLGRFDISVPRVVTTCRETWLMAMVGHYKNSDLPALWKDFEAYGQRLCGYEGSEFHSRILSLATRVMTGQEQWRLLPFLQAWGVEKLRQADWRDQPGKDGKTYPSLAANLLKGIYETVKANPSEHLEEIERCLPLFRKGAELLTQDHWPKYRYAKMLALAGKRDDAREVLKSLAAALSPQAFYWNDLAEVEPSPQKSIALRIKAISLQQDEMFLGNSRLVLATLLAREGRPSFAICELGKYEDHRRGQNKGIPMEAERLKSQIGSVLVDEKGYETYRKAKMEEAEEVLFEDLPWDPFVVTGIWKREDGKEMITLTDGKGKFLSVSRRRFQSLRKSRAGKVVELRVDKTDSRTVAMARPTNQPDWSLLPLLTGYVGFRNEDDTAYVHSPGRDEPTKIREAPKSIAKGSFVTYRLIEKKKRREVVGLEVITAQQGLAAFPKATAVVCGVNQKKRTVHWASRQGAEGHIDMEGSTEQLEVTDCLEVVYYSRKNKEGRLLHEAIHWQHVDTDTSLTKKVKGCIVRHRNGYGFIDGCFIPEQVLDDFYGEENLDEDYGFYDGEDPEWGDLALGVAVYSGVDPKSGAARWRCVKLMPPDGI